MTRMPRIEPLPSTSAVPQRAYGLGGPMDGAELGADGPGEYEVITADGCRHRYLRTAAAAPSRLGVLYQWVGRR